MQELVAYRRRHFPDAASWRVVPERYPQPDPMLLLAVREWVLSVGQHPEVGLNKQKRLASILTEILVARAAIETYLTESLASGISIGMKDTEVYAHGDVGYMAGTYTVTDAVGATIDKGRYVEIWI